MIDFIWLPIGVVGGVAVGALLGWIAHEIINAMSSGGGRM